jgi:lipoprotein signal peptidase
METQQILQSWDNLLWIQHSRELLHIFYVFNIRDYWIFVSCALFHVKLNFETNLKISPLHV